MGMLPYVALTACLAWATTLCEHGKYEMGRLSYLSFLGDKFEPRCFFWESVIIARKIGLMVAFFAFEGQESWLLAILVVAIALVAHAAFRPFEAPLTDVAEMFSLVANLMLLVSVPVYVILQDSADTERAVRIVWFLEGLAVSLILAVCIVAGYAQLHIFRVWPMTTRPMMATRKTQQIWGTLR